MIVPSAAIRSGSTSDKSLSSSSSSPRLLGRPAPAGLADARDWLIEARLLRLGEEEILLNCEDDEMRLPAATAEAAATGDTATGNAVWDVIQLLLFSDS